MEINSAWKVEETQNCKLLSLALFIQKHAQLRNRKIESLNVRVRGITNKNGRLK